MSKFPLGCPSPPPILGQTIDSCIIFLYLFISLQGANIHIVNLASKGLSLLSSLMEELKVECHETEIIEDLKNLNITSDCTSLQRMKRLLQDIPLVQVMFKQFSSLYKKVTLRIFNFNHNCKQCSGSAQWV